MIRYKCVNCGILLESPSSLAGQEDTCPICKQAHRVPTAKRHFPIILGTCAGMVVIIVCVVIIWGIHGEKQNKASPSDDTSLSIPSKVAATDAKQEGTPKLSQPLVPQESMIIKKCSIVNMVEIGSTGFQVSPDFIFPSKGNKLLWVEVEFKKSNKVPLTLDLQTTMVTDASGSQYHILGFGLDKTSLGLPQIAYLISGKGLASTAMLLLSPISATASCSVDGGSKIWAVTFEREKRAELTFFRMPAKVNLLFSVRASGKNFNLKNLLISYK